MLILAALLSGALVVTPTYRPDDVLDNRNNTGIALDYWASDSRWGFGAFASHKSDSRHTDIINAFCTQSSCSPGPGEMTYVNPRTRTIGVSVTREVTGRPWIKAGNHWQRTGVAEPVMGMVTMHAGLRRMDFTDATPTRGIRIPTADAGTGWFIRPAIAVRWYPIRALALEMGCGYELGNSPRDYRGFRPQFSLSTQF